MSRIIYLTNIPAPYRQQEFTELAKRHDFLVLFSTKSEINRQWKISEFGYPYKFLKFPWSHLILFFRYQPDILVIGGLNYVSVSLYLLGRIFNRKVIYNTDAILLAESALSRFKKILRSYLLPRMDSVIAKSISGIEYYKHYKVSNQKIFLSHYVPTLNFFDSPDGRNLDRDFDLLFSGQFIDRKNCIFFSKICQRVVKKKGSLRALLIGGGPLKNEFVRSLEEDGIAYSYPGFVQPAELPGYYARSKILLFPTKSDGWGLVANEAALMGCVVLVSPHAGAANDLIISGESGYVLELDVDVWVEKVIQLLDDKQLRETLSEGARKRALTYNIASTVNGFEDAVNFAVHGNP